MFNTSLSKKQVLYYCRFKIKFKQQALSLQNLLKSNYSLL